MLCQLGEGRWWALHLHHAGKSISILRPRDEILLPPKGVEQNILWWWQPRHSALCPDLSVTLRPGRHRGLDQRWVNSSLPISSRHLLWALWWIKAYIDPWTNSEAENENTGPLERDCVSPDQMRAVRGSQRGLQKPGGAREKSTWVKLGLARNCRWFLKEEQQSLCQCLGQWLSKLNRPTNLM